MNSFQCVKAAVVGGGAFGEVHLKTLHSMPQVVVGGLYTLDRKRGDELVNQYGGRHYQSLGEVACDPTLDLVIIATPESDHLQSFRTLAAAGKAIYVEKPLATSLAEAKEILALSSSIFAMSGHCLRFEARLASVFQSLSGFQKHHLSFRDRRTRLEKETYGRVHPAYAMLCHEIELSNAFAESCFKRVMALETSFSQGQVDGMSILIEYENGVTSSVEGGWYLPAQSNCIENDFATIVSSQGVHEVALPHLGYSQLTAQGLELRNLHYGHTVYGNEYGPVRAALDYFVTCISEGRAPQISTIEDGYKAVELIEAALFSAHQGRWVTRNEIEAMAI